MIYSSIQRLRRTIAHPVATGLGMYSLFSGIGQLDDNTLIDYALITAGITIASFADRFKTRESRNFYKFIGAIPQKDGS